MPALNMCVFYKNIHVQHMPHQIKTSTYVYISLYICMNSDIQNTGAIATYLSCIDSTGNGAEKEGVFFYIGCLSLHLVESDLAGYQ